VNKLSREYDPSTGTIPLWLSGEFHKPWLDALAAGRKPSLYQRYGKWGVKTYGIGEEEAAETKNGGEKPGASAPPQARLKVLVLRPFIPFDPATLPPRE
jgi:hypothetical protein